MSQKPYDRMPELHAYSAEERQQIWKDCSQRALRQPLGLIGIGAGAVIFILFQQFVVSGILGGMMAGIILAVTLAPLIMFVTKQEVRKKIAAEQQQPSESPEPEIS